MSYLRECPLCGRAGHVDPVTKEVFCVKCLAEADTVEEWNSWDREAIREAINE
jgi:hypothetical protein